MIARYNLRQTLLAILSVGVGLSAFALAWWFFREVPGFSIRSLGGNVSPLQQSLIAGS